METITYADFEKVDLRVGKIVTAEEFPEARKPAYKLTVDFGEEIGTKQSSAQITELYQAADLVGRLVIGVVNFPVKQIGPFMSECLIVGAYTEANAVSLLGFEHQNLPLGAKVC